MTKDEVLKLAQEVCPYFDERLQGAFYEGFITALDQLPDDTKMIDKVSIKYWVQDTVESGRWVTTESMSKSTAKKLLSDEYRDAFPQGHIVEPPNSTTDVVEPEACIVGIKGSAYDPIDTKRAYTYANQPGNVVAYKLGRASSSASLQRAGDFIDSGLILLKELQVEGYGVFDIGAEYIAPPKQPNPYDQTALELCDVCGWKTLIPDEGCLNCERGKPWVELTDDEVSKIIDEVISFNSCWGPETKFARAIEAKLKEKNT